MPAKHFLEHALAITLNHIPMTRHDPLKPPLVDSTHTLIEPIPIARTSAIPNRAFLPHRRARGTLQRAKDLGQYAARCVLACLAELLRGRQVEHHICSDERLCGLVVEDEFFVDVGGHVFPVELGIELGGYGCYGICFGEDKGEGHGLVALLGALLGEGFGTHDLCGGVGLVPGPKEDVVLKRDKLLEVVKGKREIKYLCVECGDVLHFSEF
jgi:hypothetical protein